MAKLAAPDAAPGDLLGWSVGIWGERAIVGARRDDNDVGAAYVFELLDSGWTDAASSPAATRDKTSSLVRRHSFSAGLGSS